MPGILINIDILKNNKSILLDILEKKPPKTKHVILVLFLLPNIYISKLKKYNNPTEKLKYMNSYEIKNNIYYTNYIIYNKHRNLCVIYKEIYDTKLLTEVNNVLIEYIPKNTIIKTGHINVDNYHNYIKLGFDNPYKISNRSIELSKHNNYNKKDVKSVINKIHYILDKDYINMCMCKIDICFSKKCIKYLKKLNKKFSENEQSGALTVKKVKKVKNSIIFELEPNIESVLNGGEEEVSAVWSRYNFHTHPPKAYKNNNVSNGWPSGQDYVAFLKLDNHTIFHTVVAIEGIYIISLSKYCDLKLEDIDKKYIKKEYKVNHKENLSYEEYVNLINTKTYKNTNKNIFYIKFLKWCDATKEFKIHYNKTNNKCLATEEIFNNYALI